jgi:hypothetical protein
MGSRNRCRDGMGFLPRDRLAVREGEARVDYNINI